MYSEPFSWWGNDSIEKEKNCKTTMGHEYDRPDSIKGPVKRIANATLTRICASVGKYVYFLYYAGGAQSPSSAYGISWETERAGSLPARESGRRESLEPPGRDCLTFLNATH